MAFDSKDKRLSAINWMNQDSMPEPGIGLGMDDREFVLGLPILIELAMPKQGGGKGNVPYLIRRHRNFFEEEEIQGYIL